MNIEDISTLAPQPSSSASCSHDSVAGLLWDGLPGWRARWPHLRVGSTLLRVVPAERVVVFPLLVVAVALFRVSPMPALAIAAFVATLAAFPLAARFSVTRNEQALLGVGALGLGILLPRVWGPEVTPPGSVPEGIYALGVATQLAALLRCYLRAPVGRVPATCAISLVALAAAGRASGPFGYPVFVALFLATSAFALTRADAGRPSLRALGIRHALGALVVVGITTALVVVAASSLPPLHAAMMSRLLRGLGDRTGFSEQLTLGDMRGMTQSSEVVLRARGAPVDHLRGVVFRQYSNGYWDAVDEENRKLLELEAPKATGADVVELELMNRNIVPVPLGALDLWSSTSVVQVDPQGVLHPVPLHKPKRVAFRTTGQAFGAVVGEVANVPEAVDTSISRRLRDPLAAVLARWGATSKPPRDVIRIIHARLTTDYAYSLDFVRNRNVDPVLDFLDDQRRGHCEYFASAAALLARAAGIPARVVGGYRVTEHSDFGGYAIVRERDAHAWAEVFLDGRWETLDATPSGPLGAVPETPWLGSVLDYIRTTWEKAEDWLAERSQLELSAALVGLLFVLVGVRVWRNRSAAKAPVAQAERPLEAFADLSRSLERAGVPARTDSEPVEAFARRLTGEPLDEEAAAAARGAIADYAALRYGAPRDEAAVVRAMRDARALVDDKRRSGKATSPRP